MTQEQTQKQLDVIERKTLVDLCNAGYRKYDQAMPVEVFIEDGSAIVLHYCAIPEYNGCKFKNKTPMVVDGKEYYFCRRVVRTI